MYGASYHRLDAEQVLRASVSRNSPGARSRYLLHSAQCSSAQCCAPSDHSTPAQLPGADLENKTLPKLTAVVLLTNVHLRLEALLLALAGI